MGDAHPVLQPGRRVRRRYHVPGVALAGAQGSAACRNWREDALTTQRVHRRSDERTAVSCSSPKPGPAHFVHEDEDFLPGLVVDRTQDACRVSFVDEPTCVANVKALQSAEFEA